MQKYSLALFIGRFQPFHLGHLYSLERAMELAEKVVIGIGSSQESGTESNPWSYQERERMVKEVEGPSLRGWSSQVEIVAIPDTESDEEWVESVEYLVSGMGYKNDEVVIVGNNEWVNGLMEQEGYAIFRTGLHKRDKLEGVKIREMLRSGDPGWKERVPREVGEMINLRKDSDYS